MSMLENRRRILMSCGNEITADPVLANNDWATISAVSRAGKAQDFWSVGDTKTFKSGSYTYTAQIMGFDHYDVSDPSSYGREKAGICFQTKETTVDRVLGNKAVSTAESIITSSPDIKNYAVSFKYLLGTTIYSKKGTVPSEMEFNGRKMYGSYSEGTQYPFYKNGGSKQKKTVRGSSWYSNQWLRSRASSSYMLFDASGFGSIETYTSDQEHTDTLAPVFCV